MDHWIIGWDVIRKQAAYRTTEENVALQKASRLASSKNQYQLERRVSIKCPCSGSYCDKNKNKHFNTDKHKTWALTQKEDV